MQKKEIIMSLVVLVAALKYAHENGILPSDPEDQTGSILDDIPNGFEDMQNKLNDNLQGIDETAAAQNVAAFLYMLRVSEGTAGNNGYQALFGYTPTNGKIFSSFADHPKVFYNYTNLAGVTVRTSAAGAYQITATTHGALCRKYGFAAFTPDVQDAMAVQLIKEKGALDDVKAGRFDMAIHKCRKVWASLPASNVNQPTRSRDYLAAAYQQAGGLFA